MSSFLIIADSDDLEHLISAAAPWDEFPAQNLVFLTNQHLAELLSILETTNPFLKYNEHIEELAICSDEEIDEPSIYQFSADQQEQLSQIAAADQSKILEFAEYWQETEGFQDQPVSLVEDFLMKIGQCADNSLQKKKSLFLYIDHDH